VFEAFNPAIVKLNMPATQFKQCCLRILSATLSVRQCLEVEVAHLSPMHTPAVYAIKPAETTLEWAFTSIVRAYVAALRPSQLEALTRACA
jgi:hypothetical protein